MTEHKNLIGRYYERLEGKNYLELFRYDRTQHSEIQGLKVSHLQGKSHYDVSFKRRNTLGEINTCSYAYLFNNTFHDITYHELVSVVELDVHITNNSTLNAQSIIGLVSRAELNQTSNVEVSSVLGTLIDVDMRSKALIDVETRVNKFIVENITNVSRTNFNVVTVKPLNVTLSDTSNIIVNSTLGKRTSAQLKNKTTFNSKPVKLAYLVKLIQNTSSIEANANSYVKRVKKKYLICILNKSYNIEVII